jgi:hypothetical protein
MLQKELGRCLLWSHGSTAELPRHQGFPRDYATIHLGNCYATLSCSNYW